MKYTPEQRLFIFVEWEKHLNFNSLAAAFMQQFGVRCPGRKSCYRIRKKIRTQHTAHNLNPGRSGRPRTTRSDDNILLVMGDILETPKQGLRPRSARLDIERSGLQRILRTEMKIRCYHIQRKHELKPADPAKRMTFCRWYLRQHSLDASFPDNVIWTDEAHVHLSGYVNSRNAVYWGLSKPTEVVQRGLHPLKITIWCALTSRGLIGPFYFEENGQTVTVNGIRYHDMLLNEFLPALQSFSAAHNVSMGDWWYQQDGARPHIYRPVKAFLSQTFGTRLIGDQLDHPWPPRSPDMTPLDFFLWGWLKQELYKQLPLANLPALKAAVQSILSRLPDAFCRDACTRAVNTRLRKLRSVGGGHFEHLL